MDTSNSDTTSQTVGGLLASNSNPRLSTQYSSDRVIVKLNNHYNNHNIETASAAAAAPNAKTKYHRNELKNIFSLLSNKPKISSRMNRYRLDSAASGANQSTPNGDSAVASGAAVLTVTTQRQHSNVISVTKPTTATESETAKINSDGQYSPPTTPPNIMPLGRSVSCDFTTAMAAAASGGGGGNNKIISNNGSNIRKNGVEISLSTSTTTTPQDYSIPVIDYTNDDYVITRL